VWGGGGLLAVFQMIVAILGYCTLLLFQRNILHPFAERLNWYNSYLNQCGHPEKGGSMFLQNTGTNKAQLCKPPKRQ
jgi:hypothetical protein